MNDTAPTHRRIKWNCPKCDRDKVSIVANGQSAVIPRCRTCRCSMNLLTSEPVTPPWAQKPGR